MILAIDPGKTTGLALATEVGVFVEGLTVEKTELIFAFIRARNARVIVIEDFVGAGPRTREAIMVLKTIGAVIGVCYIWGYPLVLQTPQKRLPHLADSKERTLGLSVHIRDAYAHALAYVRSDEHAVQDK